MQILVENDPSPMKLDVMGVEEWDVWEREPSEFPWEYVETETCYLLAGEAEITPVNGKPTTIRAGDLVVFMGGLQCHWRIKTAIRKHYRIG